MPRISDQDINVVRAKADIVDVISRYLQVQRKGKSYVALCPFHDDHSPSMSISPDRQIYKCFVCGAGGNVFTFVQNYEKVSFTEAVAQVANIVGYPLSLENDLPAKPEDPHKKAMYKVMEEMIRYTIYALNTNEAVLEKQYLEDRGLNDQIRAKFEIGYNPPNDALYHFLKAKGYKESDMVDCNVVRTGPRGINDVFSGRITFPIHDQHGNPIGFSARSIDPNNPSKYINTTDTELFRKSDIVYNYHRAKSQARKEGCVYVTEGVTDVIAFAKAGIDNCVCTLGTSCTDHQIQLLKSLAPKIVFCYDGDDAGQKATWRAAKMALGKNCRVTVIDNQSGKDPDEIVRSQGADGLKAMVRKELTWMEFVLMFLQKHTNMDNYSERREFVRRAEAEISLLEDELDRQHFTDELSRISGFKLNYQPKAVRQEHTSVLPAAKVPDGFAEAEDIILAMMLASPEAARRYSDHLGYLTDKTKHTASMMIIDAYRTKGRAEPSALIDETDNEDIRQLFVRLATHWACSIPYEEKILDGAIRKVLIQAKTTQADAFRQALQGPLSSENREIILNQYQECLMDLRRYIDEDNKQD